MRNLVFMKLVFVKLVFVKLVRQFHQTGEARMPDWDVPADALE